MVTEETILDTGCLVLDGKQNRLYTSSIQYLGFYIQHLVNPKGTSSRALAFLHILKKRNAVYIRRYGESQKIKDGGSQIKEVDPLPISA